MRHRLPALCALLLALLLLSACGRSAAPAPQEPTPTVTEQGNEALLGIWNNAGTYENGRDYLEILTLNADFTAELALIYDGEETYRYSGSYSVAGSRLRVTFFMNGQDTVFDYRYAVDGTLLTLQDEAGSYTFVRE